MPEIIPGEDILQDLCRYPYRNIQKMIIHPNLRMLGSRNVKYTNVHEYRYPNPEHEPEFD
jgi:hypothetical protein